MHAAASLASSRPKTFSTSGYARMPGIRKVIIQEALQGAKNEKKKNEKYGLRPSPFTSPTATARESGSQKGDHNSDLLLLLTESAGVTTSVRAL